MVYSVVGFERRGGFDVSLTSNEDTLDRNYNVRVQEQVKMVLEGPKELANSEF